MIFFATWMQDLELGQPEPAKDATRRRGCCGGACTFILAHWSKAVVLALVITVIVLFSVRVRAYSLGIPLESAASLRQ